MKPNYKKDAILLSGIIKESIVDGPGIRYVVFSQGCMHNCKGCHNPTTHNLFTKKEKSIYEIADDIKKDPLLKGVTFSGGEPFLQAEAFYNLAKLIKKMNLDIITYTGYTWEDILNSKNEQFLKLLKISDYIVDGKFEIENKTALIPFVGSSNQRIINVNKSLENNQILLANF